MIALYLFRLMEFGWIYCLLEKDAHPIDGFVYCKIGYVGRNPIDSESILSRIRELQTGNPRELILCNLIYGHRSIEKLLHRKFKHLKVRGEWFEYELQISNDWTNGWTDTIASFFFKFGILPGDPIDFIDIPNFNYRYNLQELVMNNRQIGYITRQELDNFIDKTGENDIVPCVLRIYRDNEDQSLCQIDCSPKVK